MQIQFFAGFSKKYNSTKVPLVSSATKTLNGILKEPCSIMKPIFQIERMPSDAAPYSYTYAYIGAFARWYFVNDWMWVDGLWQCYLEEDVLGSFKTQIGNSTEYVLRTDSDTNNFNGAITDIAYPATTDFDIEKIPFSNPFITTLSLGTYIVGIISGDSTDSVGAITYFAMNASQFGALKQLLFSDTNLNIMGITIGPGIPTVDDISPQVLKTLYNPYQYIASCTWFPIELEDISGTLQTSINIGWWSYPLVGKRLDTQVGLYIDTPQQVPVHPQAATRGKYLNYAPYTKLTLYGKFGSIPLDPSFMEIGSYLSGEYNVDYITGECIYQVYISETSSGTGRVEIAKTSFLLGTPIQIAQVGIDYLGAVVNAIDTVPKMAGGAIAGIASGTSPVLGAISGGASGIYNTIQSAMPQLMTSGANGSFANSQLSTILIVIHYVVVDEDIHHKGRPLCESRQLGTLSGYVLCAEGEIDLNCFDDERKKISLYLTTGFFME